MSWRKGRYPQSFYVGMTPHQQRAVAREMRWLDNRLDNHKRRQFRSQAKAQAKARRARWWAHNGRYVRNTLRVLALVLALLLLIPLLYGALALFTWAWDNGFCRFIPHASHITLIGSAQVGVVFLMVGVVIGIGAFIGWQWKMRGH